MKRKRWSNLSALAVILLAIPLLGWGQGRGWRWLCGGELRGVKFIGQQGWIFVVDRAQGFILHSTDGGNQWNIQPNQLGKLYFQGMSFSDTLNGWIVGGNTWLGEYGFVVHTSDGGRNWDTLPAPTWRNVNHVFALDSVHVWVATNGDTIFRSSDGGHTWIGSQVDPAVTDIVFLDTLLGWASSAYQGIVLRTTDGGVTWGHRILEPYNQYYSIEMIDALTGWTGGSNAEVLRTTDGWSTFTATQPGTYGDIRDISFRDAQNGMTVGMGVYRTTNGGNTWRWDSISPDFYGVDAKQLPTAWVVGLGSSIVKTTNGGDTWNILRNLDSPGPNGGAYYSELLSVSFCDADNGWASSNGVLYHTTNGGAIWKRQTSPALGGWLYGVDAVDQNYVWACSDGGRIFGTTNGGTTWALQDTAGGMLWSISFADSLVGVAVGGGTIGRPPHAYRVRCNTTDGGRTWQNSGMQIDQQPLYGVWFVNRTNGWACGGAGTVLHTTDGGVTWQTQPTNTGDHLYGITFRDTLHGLACGWLGRVVWTTDGGNNWYAGSSATTQHLNSCALADTSRGFAVSDNGLIIQTTDGGRNWFPDTSNVRTYLYSVFALDSTHVWAVGKFGMVLGYGDAGVCGIEARGTTDRETRIQGIALEQSYPNPMRENCAINFWLPKEGKAELSIYDVAGRKIRGWELGRRERGKHTIQWDGKDEKGRKVPGGVYFYRLNTGSWAKTRKMVVIR